MPVDRMTVTAPPEGPPPLRVRITEEGALLLDGEPTRVPPADTLHEFILETAQKRARARGGPVVVAIDDRQAEYAATIAVASDGSSRLADEPAPAHAPATVTAAVPVPAPSTDPSPGPAEPPEPTATFTVPEHTDTCEVYGIAAYVAYTRGDYGQAAGLFLEVARVRRAAGDSRAPHDVKWATIAWMMLGPRQAEPYEEPLLAAWSALAMDGLAPVDEHFYDCAQRAAEHMAEARQGDGTRSAPPLPPVGPPA